MLYHVIFVILCMIVDAILAVLFPNSYLMQTFAFIPAVGFCAMVLTVRKLHLIDGILFAFSFGMIYDFCFANTFLLYACTFAFIAFVIHLWSKHMMDTITESLILCISTIFVKDLVIYLYQLLLMKCNLSFLSWFMQHEALTILGNTVVMFFVILLFRIKEDYLHIRAIQTRKGETIEWYKLKSGK